ncbi:SIMPL domain-containing protein [Fredinandcohnia humi]
MYYLQPSMYNLPSRNVRDQNEENILKVLGEGSVATTPTMSTITLGVISENNELTQAQEENNQRTNRVIQSLLGIGITQQNIKTVDYRIEILYDYENSKQTLRGYRVIHMLQITTPSINQTGTIVDTAIKSGANTVTSIEFSVQNLDSFYNQALTLALTNAQSKANALSMKLGVQLQKIPIKIQELSQTPPPIPFQAKLLAVSEAATPIQPGELKISATIEAHFLFFM